MALTTILLSLALALPGAPMHRLTHAYLRDDQRLGSSRQGLKYEGQLPFTDNPVPDALYGRNAHRHLKQGNLGGNAKHYFS